MGGLRIQCLQDEVLGIVLNVQGVPFAYSPTLQQNCEIVETFHSDFQNPRKILDQKTFFQQIIWKFANIFLM